MCGRFNLTLKRKSRYSHLNPPNPISIDHEPQKTTRIRGDGNCFFRTSVFFKAGTPVHCTVFPTCVYRLSPLESKIFAANKLRLWT